MKHACTGELPRGGYGAAIDCCYEQDDDGTLWVTNSEYHSQVAFCPFCGFKAKLEPTIKNYERGNQE